MIKTMDKDIVISIKTVFYILLLLGGLYIIYILFPIISLILIAALIVIVLEPLVQYFTRQKAFNRKIHRSLAVGLTYFLTIAVVIIVFTLGLPPVVSQGQKLVSTLGFEFSDQYFELFESAFSDIDRISSLVNRGNISSLLNTTVAVFENVVTVISLLALSIYMSLDWLNIKKKLFSFLPTKQKNEVEQVVTEIESSLGNWAKGQLILMVIVGGLSGLGLMLLGVDYALALGLISGLLEIVPLLGPIISAILAFIVAYSISPVLGFATIALFLIIQQLENNLLVPKVMQKVSGFSPLVILIAVLTGAKILGFVGAIVAVPVVMVLVVIFKHVWHANFKTKE